MKRKLRWGTPKNGKGKYYTFHCPGCGYGHAYYVGVEGMPSWTFNGDLENPTFSPSLKNTTPDKKVCHLHVKNGKIEYCNDCHHHLNGQTVELEIIDEDREPETIIKSEDMEPGWDKKIEEDAKEFLGGTAEHSEAELD